MHDERLWEDNTKTDRKERTVGGCRLVSFGSEKGLDVNTCEYGMNFMVTLCINNIQHFNNQLTHTTLKNVGLLKHFKISKTAPTCFGLQGNHQQGATISTLLKITHLLKSRRVEAVQEVVSVIAAYCAL